MSDLEWLTARPIAHRGLHDLAHGRAENTLSAAAAAVASGFAIETDLQETACGDAVVFHDRSLDRLTGRTGAVADHTAAELRQITVAGTDDRIPMLADLLDLVDGKVPLVLELKQIVAGEATMARRVTELLKDYDGPVAVMSFDPRHLWEFARIAPHLPRGITVGTNAGDWYLIPPYTRFALRHILHGFSTRPRFVAFEVDKLPALAPLIARHVFGRPLLTWTVRTAAQRQTADRWADQIIFEGFVPDTG